jgi:hypothetical protein
MPVERMVGVAAQGGRDQASSGEKVERDGRGEGEQAAFGCQQRFLARPTLHPPRPLEQRLELGIAKAGVVEGGAAAKAGEELFWLAHVRDPTEAKGLKTFAPRTPGQEAAPFLVHQRHLHAQHLAPHRGHREQHAPMLG